MKKKDKKMPIIRVVNGWEKKNFIIEQEEKYNRYWAVEDKEEYSIKKFEFVVKYKNPQSENLEFEILEVSELGEEKDIDFCNPIEDFEMKLTALKSCLTFLKTGTFTIEPLEKI